jgi:hypothetical protein
MGTMEDSIAAASATVGTDLCDGNHFQQVGYNRALTGIAITGSAAAGDTKLALFVDTVKIGEYFNTTTDFPLLDAHKRSLGGNLVPAGTQIHLEVIDAPSTNPINFIIEFAELP